MLTRILKIAIVLLVFMGVAGLSAYLTVHLLIQSKNTVVVPDLEGKEVVYALEMLTDLGLNIKVPGSEFSPGIPKNHVISQDPPPGTQIKQGRDVRLVISKGTRSVIVPNLTGLSVPQARILLDENGLIEGFLSRVYDPGHFRDNILAQFPLPGHQAFRADRVHLLASAGPAPVAVPMVDLTGMQLNQAMLALEQYHLTAEAIHYIDDNQLPNDSIVDHLPKAGYPVRRSSGVQISVARRSRAATKSRHAGVDLFRYRVPPGFLRRAVKVRINRPTGSVELFNAYLRPAEEIWLLIPFAASTTLFLYEDDELISTKHYDAQE